MAEFASKIDPATLPLARVEFSVGSLCLAEQPLSGKLALRGNPADESFIRNVEGAIGVSLPLEPNKVIEAVDRTVFWRGPDEWLVELSLDDLSEFALRLETGLADFHSSVVDVSDAFTVFRLSGTGTRNVLAAGCPLDLHNSVFKPGDCAQTHYLKSGILLRLIDEAPVFDVFVRRSEAGYLWQLLRLGCESAAVVNSVDITANKTKMR